jgi:hypothetical protein
MNFLQTALCEGMHEVAMRMLDIQDEFPDLDLALHQDNNRATPVLLAVRHSHQIILVMRLLGMAVKAEQNQDANYLRADNDGKTPLLEAADKSRPDILNALLALIAQRKDACALVNFLSVAGSPLHVACRREVPNPAIIASLINHGGNVLLPDQVKKTPLDLISELSFDVINNIMRSIDHDKRAPFIPLYRKELLSNPQINKKGYYDLTLRHSLTTHLLARMEFDPAFSHLGVNKIFARLEKGKTEADAPKENIILTQAFDSMLRLANSEGAVLEVGKLLSGDLDTINLLLAELAEYEANLASRPSYSILFKTLGSILLTGGTVGLIVGIIYADDIPMPENDYLRYAVSIAFLVLAFALLIAISVGTVAACAREPQYLRRDWQTLAAHIRESLLIPLLIAVHDELPETLNLATAIQAELDALDTWSMSLPALKTHAAALTNNIQGLKNWMIRYNVSFTLFAPPPPPPVVERVIVIDDTNSADYEMEEMHADAIALLGNNNNKH